MLTVSLAKKTSRSTAAAGHGLVSMEIGSCLGDARIKPSYGAGFKWRSLESSGKKRFVHLPKAAIAINSLAHVCGFSIRPSACGT